MDAMGIQKEDQVIVYGRRGCSFTPRIWYMFKTYGHEKVGLMQGSLEEWIESKGPVDDMPTEYNVWAKDLVKISETQYPASEKDHIVDMQQVLGMLGSKTIVDTRGPGGYGKGHIPGSTNIPFSTFVDSDNSLKFKPKAELEQILDATQLNKDDEILLCCAGAVSVCHLALALDECGYSKPLVYDGSWAEWGKDPSTPKETSEND
jgi:thiosulfate/3-mercaptopyruvate sulfurtransferase